MDAEKLAQLKIQRTKDYQPPGPGNRLRGGWTLFAILVLLLGGGAWWLHDATPEVTDTAVTLLYPYQAITRLNATGYIVPQTRANVATKATGRLEHLYAEEGMQVHAGQLLAELDHRDLEANRNQMTHQVHVARAERQRALAELAESESILQRSTRMHAKNFVSAEQYDAARYRHDRAAAALTYATAAIKSAEASLEATDVALDYAQIRAPFDGVILKKLADAGDILAPFAAATQSKGAVFELADLNTLEVEADVSESSLGAIALQQACDIQLDALPGLHLRGEVHRIMPTVDRTKATVMVKVRFLDREPRLLPDMSAKVAFLDQPLAQGENEPQLAVPLSSIVEQAGIAHVFRVNDHQLESVPVKTGAKRDQMQIIQGNLQPGDRVVRTPQAGWSSGMRIRITQATQP